MGTGWRHPNPPGPIGAGWRTNTTPTTHRLAWVDCYPCSGRGWILGQIGPNQLIRVTCPVCHGTPRLRETQ